AARTRTLSLSQINDWLQRGFDLLAARRRGSPGRHQTLRATIEWSYRLLQDDERALFDQLGVFIGSFDLAPGTPVSGQDEMDAGALLEGLVLKSMVATVADDDGPRRFHVLDTLRAYALEQLQARPDDFGAARAAHALHYLDRLAGIPPWRNLSL